MFEYYKKCDLCPRKCGVNRYKTTGFCGMGASAVAAKATLHKWEEPCISYKNGAGTVFFTGCNLRCVYCQNSKISAEHFGTELSSARLSDIFLRLQESGADNIELVTPAHFLPDILAVLERVKHRLNVPVVYNSGGYELTDTIQMLKGYVDIFLPDIKYFSSDLSAKYSSAPDYFEYASMAVKAMTDQAGKLEYNSDGGLVRGTIIRHLVLPGCRHDSMKIMEWIAKNTSSEKRLVSIMSQYTPFENISGEHPELMRRVTKMEYNSVVRRADELGIIGYSQDNSSAISDYVPDFDLSGVV